jgi:hypothetical protein
MERWGMGVRDEDEEGQWSHRDGEERWMRRVVGSCGVPMRSWVV